MFRNVFDAGNVRLFPQAGASEIPPSNRQQGIATDDDMSMETDERPKFSVGPVDRIRASSAADATLPCQLGEYNNHFSCVIRHQRHYCFFRSPVCRFCSLPSATKLRQGNVFTRVCHSVHGGCLPQCMLGYTPLGRHPPCRSPGQTPPGQTPSLGRHPLPTSRRLLHQTVRILLECILV